MYLFACTVITGFQVDKLKLKFEKLFSEFVFKTLSFFHLNLLKLGWKDTSKHLCIWVWFYKNCYISSKVCSNSHFKFLNLRFFVLFTKATVSVRYALGEIIFLPFSKRPQWRQNNVSHILGFCQCHAVKFQEPPAQYLGQRMGQFWSVDGFCMIS